MGIAPFLLVVLVAQAPTAPPPRFQPYASVSGLLSVHPGTGEPYHRIDDRLNGHTWTVSGSAGVFLTPKLGLEGEIVVSGDVSAPQEFHYTTSYRYVVHNRDFVIDELVRYRVGGRGAVQVVAGGGLARTTTYETSGVYYDTGTGKETAAPDSLRFSYNRLAASGGVDTLVRAGERVSFGPTIRLRWMKRPASFEQGWTGIGDFTLQGGVTLLFR